MLSTLLRSQKCQPLLLLCICPCSCTNTKPLKNPLPRWWFFPYMWLWHLSIIFHSPHSLPQTVNHQNAALQRGPKTMVWTSLSQGFRAIPTPWPTDTPVSTWWLWWRRSAMCPSMGPQPGVLGLFPSHKIYSEALTCSPPPAAAMPTRLPAFTASPLSATGPAER